MDSAVDEVIQELITIGDFIRWGVSQFNQANLYYGHGTDNAWDEAALLVLSTLYIPPDTTKEIMDCRLTVAERETVATILAKRINQRIPAAYLIGAAWFGGLKYVVDERVLIPRSPLVELVEREFSPWLNTPITNILDLCTGSGCLAIACAKTFPDCQITATDISIAALEVAAINVKQYQLEQQVNLLHSDLFENLADQKYDIIISNPPYVDDQDMAELPLEYRYEPVLALAAGQDGLIIVKRILQQAANYLTANGLLIIEVGNSEAALIEQYPDIPFTWLEFERGGNGVFLLYAEQLKTYVSGL